MILWRSRSGKQSGGRSGVEGKRREEGRLYSNVCYTSGLQSIYTQSSVPDCSNMVKLNPELGEFIYRETCPVFLKYY